MPRTLEIPAPGVCVIFRPGTFVSHMPFSAPPSGIHEPPCGPVMNVTSWAAAGAAKVALTARASRVILYFMSPPEIESSVYRARRAGMIARDLSRRMLRRGDGLGAASLGTGTGIAHVSQLLWKAMHWLAVAGPLAG